MIVISFDLVVFYPSTKLFYGDLNKNYNLVESVCNLQNGLLDLLDTFPT